MDENKEIVVFGGCFNPPLNSHFSFAKQLLNEYPNITKVIFVPVGDDYKNSIFYEKDEIFSAKDRYNMLKSVCDKNEDFDVSDIEMIGDNQLTTYETLSQIEQENPGFKIAFLMGSDNLIKLDKWMNAEELVSRYKIYVLKRENDNIEEIIEGNSFLKKYESSFIQVKENIISNISSTYVRKKISEGKSIRYLTPDEVYYYIKDEILKR